MKKFILPLVLLNLLFSLPLSAGPCEDRTVNTLRDAFYTHRHMLYRAIVDLADNSAEHNNHMNYPKFYKELTKGQTRQQAKETEDENYKKIKALKDISGSLLCVINKEGNSIASAVLVQGDNGQGKGRMILTARHTFLNKEDVPEHKRNKHCQFYFLPTRKLEQITNRIGGSVDSWDESKNNKELIKEAIYDPTLLKSAINDYLNSDYCDLEDIAIAVDYDYSQIKDYEKRDGSSSHYFSSIKEDKHRIDYALLPLKENVFHWDKELFNNKTKIAKVRRTIKRENSNVYLGANLVEGDLVQWHPLRCKIKASGTNYANYNCHTTFGSSGTGVVEFDREEPVVVGIHSRGGKKYQTYSYPPQDLINHLNNNIE